MNKFAKKELKINLITIVVLSLIFSFLGMLLNKNLFTSQKEKILTSE